jgi:hypothetical protein
LHASYFCANCGGKISCYDSFGQELGVAGIRIETVVSVFERLKRRIAFIAPGREIMFVLRPVSESASGWTSVVPWPPGGRPCPPAPSLSRTQSERAPYKGRCSLSSRHRPEQAVLWSQSQREPFSTFGVRDAEFRMKYIPKWSAPLWREGNTIYRQLSKSTTPTLPSDCISRYCRASRSLREIGRIYVHRSRFIGSTRWMVQSISWITRAWQETRGASP